jgi:hypothetical protein
MKALLWPWRNLDLEPARESKRLKRTAVRASLSYLITDAQIDYIYLHIRDSSDNRDAGQSRISNSDLTAIKEVAWSTKNSTRRSELCSTAMFDVAASVFELISPNLGYSWAGY